MNNQHHISIAINNYLWSPNGKGNISAIFSLYDREPKAWLCYRCECT